MTKVQYTKKEYQKAKKTPEEDRTAEQQLLVCIDFRQGPNPMLRLESGKVHIIKPGLWLAGEKGKVVTLTEEEPADEKKNDAKPTVTAPKKGTPSLDVSTIIAKNKELTDK